MKITSAEHGQKWMQKKELLKKIYLYSFTIAENVSRQCLPGGTWFYCPGPNISLGVGWTNWSHCWSASTEKIMADLNQKAICPSDENQDNSAEVNNYCLLSDCFLGF